MKSCKGLVIIGWTFIVLFLLIICFLGKTDTVDANDSDYEAGYEDGREDALTNPTEAQIECGEDTLIEKYREGVRYGVECVIGMLEDGIISFYAENRTFYDEDGCEIEYPSEDITDWIMY